MDVIKKYRDEIINNKLLVHVLYNDDKREKCKQLKAYTEQEQKGLGELGNYLEIEILNQDFKELFNNKKTLLKNEFNLFFLDQSGVKQINDKIFVELTEFQKTDFMFFISSSYFKRFATDFKEYIPNINLRAVSEAKHSEMHRLILQCYRKIIPTQSKVKLYPFTIKKGANIYGLIFGSNHPLGVDKFLKIAWETNELNGEANFDIDNDWQAKQGVLFGKRKLSKIETFERELKELILSRKTVSNVELYFFTLQSGHIDKHAQNLVRRLKKEGIISFSGHPNISYNKCCKDEECKYFEVIK